MIVCVILWFLIVCQDFFFFVSSELSCNMIVILFGSVWKSFDGFFGAWIVHSVENFLIKG